VATCNEIQTQHILQTLDPALFKLQFSCWNATIEKPWCGECPKCAWIKLLWNLLGLDYPNPPYNREDSLRIYNHYALELGPNNDLCTMRSLLENIVVDRNTNICKMPMKFTIQDDVCRQYRLPKNLEHAIHVALFSLGDPTFKLPKA
jgi:hypothetical protein